ncbi:MAG: deoxynucleoside kinase [Bacteroidales bacterium]|nr:deoxynucleoside kinase [Bacteroidales bacterium]
MFPYRYIVIEGNIGAGKTTLAGLVAARLNARLVLERFEDNSFLPKFYREPDRYAFPLEMSFLSDRYQQMIQEFNSPDLFQTGIVSDYFIDKSLLFARNNLAGAEFGLFSRFFHIIAGIMPAPDILVYLHAEVPRLRSQIMKRGRDFEKDISDEYLTALQKAYLEYLKRINSYPVLVMDTRHIDFLSSSDHIEMVLDLLGKKHQEGFRFVSN